MIETILAELYLIGDEADVDRRCFQNILLGFFRSNFALVSGPANSAEHTDMLILSH